MVGDADQAALTETLVDSASGVGDDEAGATEQREDPRGEDDLGHWVAFVSVDAALHHSDCHSAYRPEDQLAGVALHRGERPAGDVGVRDGRGVLDLRCEVAETGAEDDAQCGLRDVEGTE